MTNEGTKLRTRSLEVIQGLLPLVLGFQLMVWLVYLPSALHGNADFRNCYSSGLLLRDGRGSQIYNYEVQRDAQNSSISRTAIGMPYVHPPYEVLLFAPLSLVSYRFAFIAWLAASLGFLAISYWLLKGRLWRLRKEWNWLPILFLVGFAPVSAALLQGQDSLLTLLLFSTALLALESGNDLLGGVFVGLAAYKFQLILPIVGFFFLWRRWRFTAGASLSSFCTILVSASVCGLNTLLSYPRYVRETSVNFAVLMPANRMPNLRGLISWLPLNPRIGVASLTLLSIIVVILAWQRGRGTPVALQFAIAISAATLVGYHVMMHDLSVMLIPMSVLLGFCKARNLWSITLAWLTAGLSFFGMGPLVSISFVILLICLTKPSLVSLTNVPDPNLSSLTDESFA